MSSPGGSDLLACAAARRARRWATRCEDLAAEGASGVPPAGRMPRLTCGDGRGGCFACQCFGRFRSRGSAPARSVARPRAASTALQGLVSPRRRQQGTRAALVLWGCWASAEPTAALRTRQLYSGGGAPSPSVHGARPAVVQDPAGWRELAVVAAFACTSYSLWDEGFGFGFLLCCLMVRGNRLPPVGSAAVPSPRASSAPSSRPAARLSLEV